MRPRCLAVAVGLALSAPLYPSTVAAVPSPAPEPTTLDAVIVVATREAGAIADAPATVGVVPRQEIERTQAQDLRELFRYQRDCSAVRKEDAGGHARIMESLRLAHAELETCLGDVLALEGWDPATLSMPEGLRQLRDDLLR